MKIVVCVKQICHTYARTGMAPEQNYLTPEDRVYRVNPHDEVAMELAARIKALFAEVEILAVTLGPIIAESELRRCLALGADHFFQIDKAGTMDPWRKAAFLAEAIKPMEPAVILCGKESLDTRNGQVGAFLAHRLGLPFISAITDLEVNRNTGNATVKRSAGRGKREVIECKTPALFSVDLGAIGPHFPTYEDKQAAWSLPVQKLSIDEVTAPGNVVSEGLFPPRPRPKPVPPIDTKLEAYDRIQQLLSGSRVEKKGVMLRGDSESQVDGMISFLKKHGLL